MTYRSLIPVILIIMSLTTCQIFSNYKVESFHFNFNEKQRVHNIYLSEITVTKGRDELSQEYPYEETIFSLLDKYEISYEEKTQTNHAMSVWIKEKSILKGFNKINSITAIINIKNNKTGEMLIKTIYRAETKESIESFYHTYDILESAIADVSKIINAK